MPTGYTADVATGEISDFQTFAMRCARAFGALATMRDDPPDAEIPVFVPSDYHEKALEEAIENLCRLRAMTRPEIISARDAAEAERQNRVAERESQRAEQESRYRRMLTKVAEWVPPTPDHDEMKSFMAAQLAESIDFDCSPIESEPLPSASAWYLNKITRAESDVANHRKKHAEEVERVRSRNKLVSDLRRSLGQET